jgi:thymidylate synthase
MININKAIQNVLNTIEDYGYLSKPRDMEVKEVELETITISSNYPYIDFEARPMNWRYFLGELVWYLKRDRSTTFINKFSTFWKGIENSDGTINSNYGTILFGSQLEWVKNSLLNDKNTRQAVAVLNQPHYQYVGNKDFVCTMYLNFWIRRNELHMKVQMRSNDIFYGLTYDVPFFAFIQQTVYFWLKDKYNDLTLGNYYHCADNLHYYKRHFDIADSIRNEKPRQPQYSMLIQPLFKIENGNYWLTDAGNGIINTVDTLLENNDKISQETAKTILQQFFHIQ